MFVWHSFNNCIFVEILLQFIYLPTYSLPAHTLYVRPFTLITQLWVWHDHEHETGILTTQLVEQNYLRLQRNLSNACSHLLSGVCKEFFNSSWHNDIHIYISSYLRSMDKKVIIYRDGNMYISIKFHVICRGVFTYI